MLRSLLNYLAGWRRYESGSPNIVEFRNVLVATRESNIPVMAYYDGHQWLMRDGNPVSGTVIAYRDFVRYRKNY